MSARSRTSLPGLLARQFRADLGPLVAMALIVFVVATLASAAPLALRAMTSAEVEYHIDTLPAVRRDLTSLGVGSPSVSPSAAPFGDFEATLSHLTTKAPAPLREALGTANFVASTSSLAVSRLDVDWNDPLTPITLNTTSDLASHVTLSSGALPGPFKHVFAPGAVEGLPSVSTADRNPADPSIDIAISTASAQKAEWKVGEERLVIVDKDHGFYAKLTGTFDAIDPADGFWATARYTLTPGISATSFSGTATPIVTSAAYIDPGSWATMLKDTRLNVTTSVGIPFSVAGLTVDEVRQALPQLRNFLSQSLQITNIPAPGEVASLTLNSDAGDALSTAVSRSTTATSVLVMVASGPIGVAIAVLWLLSRLIVLRRRDALTLASARGASSTQLRLVPAAHAFALSLPSAAIGALIAAVLFPESWTPLVVVIAGVVALVPPVLISAATSSRSFRGTRVDLSHRGGRRYRWVLEIIVLALTTLAVTLLLQRGLATESESITVDPLLAATPLLLSLSAGLFVLRLYPLPLIWITRAAQRRRGVVSFLGANRSIREPAAGLATVLAMVVGLAVAVFSGVMLGTVVGGVGSAAHSSVGADLRIDSPILSTNQLEQIADVEGVAESVALYQDNRIQNLSVRDRSAKTVNLSEPIIVVDTAALARVQHGVPGAARFEATMSKATDGAIPVVLSPWLAAHYTIAKDSSLAGVDIVTGGDAGSSPSLSGTRDWVLIDVANSEALGIAKFLPRITLVSLDADADVATVKAALSEIAGPDATITSPADAARLLNESPVAFGLQLALLALIVIVGLLCATAVVLALMINGPARERLLALLRTLGLSRRQARGITAWEIAPSAAVAVVLGLILGAALPLIVLAGLDLRPFTGGVLQPDLIVNPTLLALIIGAFALIVAIATAIALIAARRVNLARTVRTSEEG